MKLNVPLIRQAKGSVDCGLAGLAMIFKYYGKPISLDKLKKEIKVYEVGTYAPQLGIYLLDKGFDVEIVTIHPKLFTMNNLNASKTEILKIFDEKSKHFKNESDINNVGHFKKFLNAGGKIKVAIPSIEDIREEIDESRPVGALMTTNFIKGEKPIFNFHFNVVTGYDSDNVYVNDPISKGDPRGGKQAYDKKVFFYGLYASAYGDIDNACLIKIKKKETKKSKKTKSKMKKMLNS